MTCHIEKHSFSTFLQLYKADCLRFKSFYGMGRKAGTPFLFLFRFGNYLLAKDNLFAKLFFFPVSLLYFAYRLYIGVDILLGTNISEGLSIPHPIGIVISSNTVIGKNCTIHQNVTIGSNPIGRNIGVPIIGNNTVIFAGAVICGNVHIGDNVMIGANAVITKDVPDNCIVAGVPGKILSNNLREKVIPQIAEVYRLYR